MRLADDTALLELQAPVPPAGVGLAVARAVVLLHKGRLELRPGPREAGATMALPVTGPPVDDLAL